MMNPGVSSFYAIIVAGGKGLRMGSDLPKQFLPIGGRPVLMHTLEAFERAIHGIHLILVLPADQQDFWRELCERHAFTLPHSIATGGEARFHSVLNGLKTIKVEDSSSAAFDLEGSTQEGLSTPIVGVHDGVRPFVSPNVICRCFDAARVYGAAVPVVPVVETIRELIDENPANPVLANSAGKSPATPVLASSAGESPATPVLASSAGEKSVTRDRSHYRLVQTPQTFQLALLRKAYEQPYRASFTDDASVVEALGHPITLVEGNRENIKITTPFDLTVAEALLSNP